MYFDGEMGDWPELELEISNNKKKIWEKKKKRWS